MSEYIDGFLLPLPKDKIAIYQKMATEASKIWMEHGALAYRECVGDDLETEQMRPFSEASDAGPDETVVLAYITYKSREHRDEVNAKVMSDPRLAKMMEESEMPFDCKRMAYGGFRTIVSA